MLGRALVWVPTAFVVAVAMDLWAGLLHRSAWHRGLWRVHRSHHRVGGGGFEANDFLSALHAPLAIALIVYGCAGPPGAWREVAYGFGVGMSVFGVAYLLVHDGVVHGRLPVRWLLASRRLRRVAAAHRVHHTGTLGGPPFALFFGPYEMLRASRIKRTERARVQARTPSVRQPPGPSRE